MQALAWGCGRLQEMCELRSAVKNRARLYPILHEHSDAVVKIAGKN